MPETEVYSNPLPPNSRAYYDDDDDYASSASNRLTNDDFRKLMMTPRVSGDRTSSSHSFATPYSKQKSIDSEDPNDPGSLRRKKKSYYAQLKKAEDEREKELAMKYRDRARERRDGVTGEAPVVEDEVSTTANYKAVAPDAKIPSDQAERRKRVIQESKYLGGDMEHTHLVKGLDYALLEKVKAEIVNKEQEDEEMESIVKTKQDKQQEDIEEQMKFKTIFGRNIFRSVFRARAAAERNELFLPGRMAYVIDLEEDGAVSAWDIPTTLIRSKADCPNLESTSTLTDNHIVINKLTQILSYLRQGKRDKKKKKDKGKVNEDKGKMVIDDIYGGATDIVVKKLDHPKAKIKELEKTKDTSKKSYFEKPKDEEDPFDKDRKIAAKDFVNNINERFGKGNWGASDGINTSIDKKMSKEDEQMKKLKSKTDIDSYAECYPGMMESADANGDSDDEADYMQMDQGNRKGPVGRWDFETQEDYSQYMSHREAMPKAAFQYGVKMADGRKTRRAGPKDEKKELDKEWTQIQNIIATKRKGNAEDAPNSKYSKY